MRNSAVKRAIAILLCLVVFAGSELTGVTNIVGDLFANEMSEGDSEGADLETASETVEVEAEEEVEEVEEEPGEVVEDSDPEDTVEAEENTESAEEATDNSEIEETNTNEEEDITEVIDTDDSEANTDSTDNGETDSTEDTDADVDDDDEVPAETDGEDNVETSADSEDQTDLETPADQEDQTDAEVPADTEEEEEQKPAEEEEPEALDEEYKDGQVIIHVEAEPGVVPNGTRLSVKKIVQQDVEALDDEEEIKEAEELNAKYEDIQAELELSVADDDTKEIAAFVAYDVNFLLTDEDGETTEIEPDGEVSVSIEFEEAYLPEEIAEKEDQIDIESIDVIHMEEAEEDEESETGLKSEVVANADVSTAENAVEKAEFTTGSGKTFVITWTENDLGEREYVCETEDATIKVTAAKGVVPDGALLQVVPILANNEATQKQYQDVEKKLLEKAESEAYEIAGFLAYDISFTDETGAKLEPNGEVKVAIDYKKAAIPEELKDLDSATYALDDAEEAEEDDTEAAPEKEAEETSENSDSQTKTAASTSSITVMHLEENDQGQVTKVVDMGAEGKVTELNSTKDQKVTSTEFVTESFSTFTIVWKNEAGTWEQSIDVKFYRYSKYVEMPQEGVPEVPLEDLVLTWEDETGGEIDLNTITIIDSGKWEEREQIIFKTSDISENGRWKDYYRLKDEEGNSYVFYKAIIVQTNEAFNANLRADLETILYNGFGFDYTNSKETGQCFMEAGWKRELRFYYIPELKALDTIDNNDYGITMRMINYTDHTFQDSLLGTPYGNTNRWWNNGAITQGAVKPRLENGYPVTKGVNGSVAGNNLAVLFGGASNPNATVQKVNGLFLKDIYEDTGYFQYSSFQNYACLENETNDKGEHDFTVYNGIGSTEYTKFEYHPFYRGNFFPYNEITPGIFAGNYNKYSANGEELPNNDIRKGELLYRVDKADYCFGMYIEAAFVQPQGGIVEHNGEKSPMEYKFTGDDDLWVFIDDSLVLDIGGAHHACSGSINFKDGTVTVDGKKPTTIKAMFKDSGYFPDGSIWEEAKADLYFDGDTFKDYSTHRIKMFYMEHGDETADDNASNLQVTMNLPTINIPTGTVRVKKELDNTDKEAYKDVEFAFQIFAQEKTGENEAGDIYSNTKYVALDVTGLKDEKGDLIKCNTEKNVFYLKPDQVAVFEGLQSNRKYYVKEIGVESNLYDKVTIEGGPRIEEINGDGESTFANGVESSALPVEARPSIIFTNKCSAANSRELRITKAKEGDIPDQQFTFQVYLGGQKDPYTGPYVLEKADGSKTEVTSSDGKIRGVSVGDTIVIDKIMSGTKYKVVEVELADPFVAPTIEGKNVKTDKTETLISNESRVANTFENEILLDCDAVVTVTNKTTASKTSDLHIKKEMKEEDLSREEPFIFRLTTNNSDYNGNYYLQDSEGKKYQYDSQSKKLEPLADNQYGTISNGTVYIPAGYIAVIPDLEEGTTFQVTEQLSDEEKEIYVYPPQMKVNDTEVDEKKEIASGTITKDQNNVITVTNSLKSYSYTWEIVKVGSASGTAPLKGAMFELTSDFKDGKTSVTYSGESGDNGVIVWKQDGTVVDPETFQIGQYKLKETKAPENHMISGKEWTITLTYDGVTIQEPKDDGTGLQIVSPKSSSNKDQYTYEFFNAVIYELPSTGGAGIFGYMISGVLLMIAGVLVLYKRKYAGRC